MSLHEFAAEIHSCNGRRHECWHERFTHSIVHEAVACQCELVAVGQCWDATTHRLTQCGPHPRCDILTRIVHRGEAHPEGAMPADEGAGPSRFPRRSSCQPQSASAWLLLRDKRPNSTQRGPGGSWCMAVITTSGSSSDGRSRRCRLCARPGTHGSKVDRCCTPPSISRVSCGAT